ncbi:ABC transporter substrate-binding protein [Sporolactobacillus shoreicorticis]|uniref:ABC transporter substrate-binding protein n=1 Tax=Sporolactobacillus shoreicorticis TaxID=1923877 RepID=A0ABW5S7U9_9BACL|nr:ABC transporter substrate-binding protein [Sporolactobacillus shoreicorticis]MCO7125488.1 ABC transporter substrate-binding protein [Sporolactobacillus shoreicorticis]
MIRRLKRLGVSFVLLIGILVVLLSGCTSGNQSGSGETHKTVIEYWHVNAQTQGGQAVDELVKDFNAKSKDVKVVAKYNPDMYKGLMQNLQAEKAAGKSPALVQVGWAYLDYFSNNFSYLDPNDAIAKFDPKNKSFLKENFLPNVLHLAQNKKGQVGIPYSLSSPVLYLNKDLLKKAGLNENGPSSWQEVRQFADTIKKKTGNYGLYVQEPADTWAQQALMLSNGAQIITKKGKAVFASKEGIEAYQLYQDMVVKDKSALHLPWDQGVDAFVKGKVGMLYTTIAQMSNVKAGAQFKVSTIPSPPFEGKEAKVPAGGSFLAITAQSEDQQKAAWEFEKYLYSRQSMAKWTEATGYVPPRKDVAQAKDGLKDYIAENPMLKAALDQMDKAVPWTSFPGNSGLQAEQIMIDSRDKILGGSGSVSKTLKDAQQQINQLEK